jgi:hypothetical protein
VVPRVVLEQAFLAVMTGCYLGQFLFYGFEAVLLSVCQAGTLRVGVCFKMTTVIYFTSVGLFSFFFIRDCRRVYA